MNNTEQPSWIAFAKSRRIASGAPRDVATKVKDYFDTLAADNILVFDARTSVPVEIDLRGSVAAVLRRLPAPPAPATAAEDDTTTRAARAPGRPKLGVTAREVTLLPRHWEWLATQPGGASVALRKLVEQARRAGKDADRLRRAQEAAYRFMTEMAGDNPGYEEATRALFAADLARLGQSVAKWPRDVREHVLELAQAAVAGNGEGAPLP